MIKATFWGICTGFLALVSIMFGLQNNIDNVLGGPTQNPTLNVYYWAFTNQNDVNAGIKAPLMAMLVAVLILLCNFMNGLNQHTVTTRITYALARDGGLPGSWWLSYLNPITKNPDRTTIAAFLIQSILSVLPIFS